MGGETAYRHEDFDYMWKQTWLSCEECGARAGPFYFCNCCDDVYCAGCTETHANSIGLTNDPDYWKHAGEEYAR